MNLLVSQLAPAQLFSPHVEPGPRAHIATFRIATTPPPRRASAQAVQEPAQKVVRAQ